MKKTALILAVVLVGLSATAQEAKNERRGQQRPQPEQMAAMATRQMTERYSLTADQAKAVAELNRQYAGKVPMRFGFGKGPGPDRGPQARGGERPQAQNGERPQVQNGHRPQRQELTKDQQTQLKKDRKAYTKGLKKIMDKTQFKAYQKDLAEMEEAAWNRPAGGPGSGFGPGNGGPGMDRSSAPAEGFRNNPGNGLGSDSGHAGLGGPEI